MRGALYVLLNLVTEHENATKARSLITILANRSQNHTHLKKSLKMGDNDLGLITERWPKVRNHASPKGPLSPKEFIIGVNKPSDIRPTISNSLSLRELST